jgi:hypothetical protein
MTDKETVIRNGLQYFKQSVPQKSVKTLKGQTVTEYQPDFTVSEPGNAVSVNEAVNRFVQRKNMRKNSGNPLRFTVADQRNVQQYFPNFYYEK